ncbi:MAG: hypothetical protein Tsb0020_51860 [Haliangiales bacterium]
MASIALLASVCVLPAEASYWPKPAGGPSASGGPEVIFTFDDGPHYQYTEFILDELKRRDIKGVFFWVGHRVMHGGSVDEQIELVHRAVREGHIIANHTINHVNLCQVDTAEAAREIDANGDILHRLSGLPMVLFRSPYGARCRRLVRMLDERSILHLHWDIDPQEWIHHDSDLVQEYVIRKLKNLKGRAVVLMHDTKAASAYALPRILDWIERENERRVKAGDAPPIRILTGSHLAAEHLDPALPHWLADTTDRSLDAITHALARLIP